MWSSGGGTHAYPIEHSARKQTRDSHEMRVAVRDHSTHSHFDLNADEPGAPRLYGLKPVPPLDHVLAAVPCLATTCC
jgi:hypothetical protein